MHDTFKIHYFAMDKLAISLEDQSQNDRHLTPIGELTTILPRRWHLWPQVSNPARCA